MKVMVLIERGEDATPIYTDTPETTIDLLAQYIQGKVASNSGVVSIGDYIIPIFKIIFIKKLDENEEG